MTFDEPWREVLEAENNFLLLRMALFAGDADDQLSRALNAPEGRGMALRMLVQAPVEHVERHAAAIFEMASSTHGQVGLARQVLARLNGDVAKNVLGPLVRQRLQSTDERWEAYRRSAEVLQCLGQTELLRELVVEAGRSTDEDILEVAEDYAKFVQPVRGRGPSNGD